MESRVKVLGHPVHPMLVMFPVALLITGTVFDLVDAFGGSAVFGEIAFWNITIGIIVGLIAAAVGSLDLASIPRRTRAKRVGPLHAAINVAVILLFAAVWALRVADDRYSAGGALVAIEVVALAGLGVSGWLGGELVDRLGVGVDDNANLDAPSSLRGPVPGSATEREGRPLDRPAYRARPRGARPGRSPPVTWRPTGRCTAPTSPPATGTTGRAPASPTPTSSPATAGRGDATAPGRRPATAVRTATGQRLPGDRGTEGGDEVRRGASGIAGRRRGGGDGTRTHAGTERPLRVATAADRTTRRAASRGGRRAAAGGDRRGR